MNKKSMPLLKSETKQSIHGIFKDGKRELSFEFSLPALVTGHDSSSQSFREKTQLLSISAEEVKLWLRSRVTIGARIDLCLDIPHNPLLGNNLKLALSGTVVLAQSDENAGRQQIVAVRLDKRFKIQNRFSANS